ncbi:MAG: hypothetical protein Unbinned4026contig1002_5 [Prokaryotic dsDNA virus sp.]|nr:MAG: hypothetical protein Unbinned4026contig1002_5 [Prokaryotic dsDNA virus sp.]
MTDTSKIMQWLNQKVNLLQPNETKEYLFNSEYAGRRVRIKVNIDAINNNTETSSIKHSQE